METLIGDVFRNAARAAPTREAARLGERVLTFSELDRDANRHASALRGMGIGLGDRVVVWNETSLDALPLFAACAKLGAVYAPVNARLSGDEARAIVEYARPRLLVVDAVHAAEGESMATTLGIALACMGAGASGPGASLCDASLGSADSDVLEPRLRSGDPHVIFFTSGSTGRPKGVILSHRANWLRSFGGAILDERAGTVCMFPLFHMSGWSIALGCWQTRSPITFVPDPTADNLLDACRDTRPERLYCIPAVWRRILDALNDAPAERRQALSSLVFADTGTSATPPELLSAMRDALPHTRTRVFYGSTEAGSGTQLAHTDLERKPGSCGLPQPGVEVRLSETGEVQIRNVFLFDGYFDNEEATAAALVDGWYQTGDRGVFDDEGYLSIVGRARDLIRSAGEWVAPPEIESVLASHPAVADVAVVGIPDATWGEVVCAVVVARAGHTTPTLEELRAHCAPHLASYKHPRRLEIVDAFPRTAATGQIQRTLIVERIVAG